MLVLIEDVDNISRYKNRRKDKNSSQQFKKHDDYFYESTGVNRGISEISKEERDKIVKVFGNLKYSTGVSNEYRKLETRLLGYTPDQLQTFLEKPHLYQVQLIDISNFFFRYSSFFRRIVESLAYCAMHCWDIDTCILDQRFYNVNQNTLKKNYIAFSGAIEKLRIDRQLFEAMLRVILEDIACGIWLENNNGESYIYWIPSHWVEVRRTVDGYPYFGILPQRVPQLERARMPVEIQQLLEQPVTATDPYVYPDPDKAFCLKWNHLYNFAYPSLFSLLNDLIDIDDYKQLHKSRTESENYNALGLEVPIDDSDIDKLMLTKDLVVPVAKDIRNALPSNIGMFVSPMKMNPIQWRSSGSNERNNVKDAISQFYDEAGFPKDLFSSAKSPAAIRLAITNFSTGIYMIYRQIERAVMIKMYANGFNDYPSYRFTYSILDITHFNKEDYADHQLKMANASTPNKSRLMSSIGFNPSRRLGNEYMENAIFNIGSEWTILKSSHTTSNSSADVGAPEMDDNELSDAGQDTRDSGANESR